MFKCVWGGGGGGTKPMFASEASRVSYELAYGLHVDGDAFVRRHEKGGYTHFTLLNIRTQGHVDVPPTW